MRAKQDRATYESQLPFDVERIVAAAVYCSDGRFGEQIDDLLHNFLRLPCCDRVAVPGGPAALAGHFGDFFQEQAMARQLEFLIHGHQLHRVVLIAHQDCLHYLEHRRINASEVEQRQCEDLKTAARRIRGLGSEIQIEAFFARKVEGRVRFEAVEC